MKRDARPTRRPGGARPPAAAAPARDRATWPWIAAVAVAAMVPFLPALRGEFLTFDDDAYVSANRAVLAGVTASGIRWAFTTFTEGNYHPLTWLSLMLDAQIFGTEPWGFHLTSLLVHGANAALFFLVLRRVGGSPPVAALAAVLWAVHPLRTESVAWISERKDVLSVFFGLIAILTYLGWRAPRRDRPPPAVRPVPPPEIRRVAAWMALSLLAKPMLVTLPVLLMLLDVWPLGRLRRVRRDALAAVVEKWPLWLLSLMAGSLAIVSQRSRTAMAELELLPIAYRLTNAIVSYGRYLAATLWPVDLAAFYPFPPDGWPAWQWLGVAALLVAITAALALAFRRLPSLLIGWAWYAVALAPVSGLMQVGGQAMADRFAYLPAMGLFMGVVGALPAKLERRAAAAAAAVAALACLALGVLSWRQSGYWQDTVTLMRHTVDVTGFNLFARSSLAHAYLARGDYDAARPLYEEVLRARPDIAKVHVNLGIIAAAKGQPDRAIAHYREAIRIDGGSFEAYNNLGAALLERSRSAEATAALDAALRLRPGEPDVLFNLGIARAQSGDLTGAAQAYEAVLAATPRDAEAHYRAGALRLRLGEAAVAEKHLRAALALQPDHSQAAAELQHLIGAPAGAPGAPAPPGTAP